MTDLRAMFFEECDELLEALTAGMAELERGASDDETINAMFRAVHSIKGGAGAFGLDQLVSFSHAFENVLDDIRSGKTEPKEPVVRLLFAASDQLTDIFEAARDEGTVPEEQIASILSDLKLLNESVNVSNDPAPQDEVAFVPMALDLADLSGPDDLPAIGRTFEIRFTPRPHLYETGNDPALLIRSLAKLGRIDTNADLSAISTLSKADWQAPVITWAITLQADDGVDRSAISDVFEFVDMDCEIDIHEDEHDVASPPEPVIAEQDVAQTVTEHAAVEPAKTQAKPSSQKSTTIRVDLDRVDRLINLVGELVISEAMLRQSMSQTTGASNSTVEAAMGQLKQLSGILQESVMAIRAQPVTSLFQRMGRIVRESAKEAGKSAKLVTLGDTTEVDKTVIERLVDPLTHMIRNAVDHGLERAEERRAVGKPEQGTVTLSAAHRSGRVVIALSDDGAGINRPRVRQIAEEKGLIQPEDELSDADIDNLLFRPGFSTNTEVSNLSGRGVGMDVVRSEIQALGGRVSLSSTPGEGTTLTISLPLTLAVLEGMIVKVDNEVLVVPTLALRETLQSQQADIHILSDDDKVLVHDSELVPVVDLGSALGYRETPPSDRPQTLLLIEGDSGARSALSVDEIFDQREVVIKGLEQNYQRVPGIAAATILGDGNIALIVDTDQMMPISRQTLFAADLPFPNSGALQHA